MRLIPDAWVPGFSRAARAAGAAIAAAALAGCAASTLSQARLAENEQDYDTAIVEYTKALREHPGDRKIQLELERAKLRAADVHLMRGRRLAGQANYEDAVVELQIADELNPGSGDVERALHDARTALRAKLAAPAEGQTPLESLLAQTRDLPPTGAELPNPKLPQTITTSAQATSRQVYLMIARLANLSVTFDSAFVDTPAQVSLLNDMTLRQALDAVSKATGTFYTVSGQNTITVVPDTPAKRREYTEEVARTLYLQNADLKETMDALRIVGDLRNIAPVTGTNAIVVRDTPDRVQVAGRILSTFDKARPEVVVDVEILEVDRTKLQEYGLQIASAGSAGINGNAAVDEKNLTLRSLRNLTDANVIVSGVPALYYRLLKTDTNTRTLANPHLRITDGTAATAEFGENVPVPRVTFVPIAQGSTNEQPITQYDYKNIGVNVTLTPRTYANDEVSLALNVELTSISGTGFGGLPTFGNRHVATSIRLKDGETNILAGLLRQDESITRDGVPGLSDLPGIGKAFTHTTKNRTETDVVIMLTPHIVRSLALTADDLRPVRIPRDGTGAPGLEGPPVPSPPIIRGPGGGGDEAPGLNLGPLPVAPVPAPPPLRVIRHE